MLAGFPKGNPVFLFCGAVCHLRLSPKELHGSIHDRQLLARRGSDHHDRHPAGGDNAVVIALACRHLPTCGSKAYCGELLARLCCGSF